MKLFFKIIPLFALTPLVHAEALRFATLNSSDGLPQNSVRGIVQDQNGLMWFATEDGVARYDGKEVIVYRYNPKETNPIPDNVINQMLAVGENQLWMTIQGDASLTVLDQTDQVFYEIDTTFSSTAASSRSTSAIYQRNNQDIVIGSTSGVFSVSAESLAINEQLLRTDQFSNSGVITSIWEDSRNNLWIASADGKLGYLTDNGIFRAVPNKLNSIASVKSITGVGDIVVAGSDGLFQIDYNNDKLIPLYKDTFLNDRNVRDITQAPNGDLWIATTSGLIRYNLDDQTAVLAEKNPADENALPTNELTTLYISSDEILWIGTTDKGVVRTNLKDYGFVSYSSHNLKNIHPVVDENRVSDSFKSNMIWSIHRDSKNSLWIGHTEGISVQEQGQESFKNLSHIGIEDTKFDVSESWIMSIHETGKHLWFGTWGEGLIRHTPDTQETVVFSADSPDANTRLSGNIIRLLLWDKARDSLWVGTHRNGLNRINLSTSEISYYLPDDEDDNAFPHPRSRALYLGDKNQLWVGTGGGLARFNDSENNFQLVNQFPENETFSDVRGIYQTDEDTIWAANGYGLDQVNTNDLSVEKRLLEKDGLSRSALYGIIADSQGKLWIPTIKGLSRFDPQNDKFQNFYVDHKLQSNEFNFNAAWKEKDGSIILGGTSGITKFNPNLVKEDFESANPVILNVKAVNQQLTEESVLGVTSRSKKDAFVLQPSQRSLIIDFTIPEFVFQNSIGYQYKLAGNDSDWTAASRRDTPVRYTNLSPGMYEFQVRAIDDTSENNIILSIGFSALPHVWERIWFKLISALLILLALFYTIKKLLSYRLEKTVTTERSQLYSMIIHELGPSLKRSQEDLTLLSDSTNNSEELVSDLHSENQYTLSFIEQLRALNTVEGYTKKSEQEFLLEDIWDESIGGIAKNNERIHIDAIPDATIKVYENSVQFVIRNLISNAIKYSHSETPIVVSLTIEHSDLNITVSDNGFGIKDELKQKVLNPYERGDMYRIEGLGLGLNLVKNIAHKYNGSISIADNLPQGSKVLVTLRNIVK